MEVRRTRGALTAALLLGACASLRGTDEETLGLVLSPVSPARSVPTEGGTVTLAELEIRNRGEGTVLLEGASGDEELGAAALALRLVPRVRAEPARRLVLAEGARTALLCRAVSPTGAAPPESLAWSVAARGPNVHGFTVAGRARGAAPADPTPPRVLGAPLAGGGWLVENGPAVDSGHRRAIVWIGGRARAAQRFAVDFFRADASGATSRGPRREDHLAWGADVLAVADADVVAAVDGIPDNVPGSPERAVEMSRATVAGNHVVLDLGGGAFAMLAHLREGSVAVRAGERVSRGQVVGAVGNSGNSTEPHLHLHVADGPSPVDADGLPFVFDAFEVERGAPAGQRSGSLPGEGCVVAFPSRRNGASTAAPQDDATR